MRYRRSAIALAACAFLAGPLCTTAQQTSQSTQATPNKSLGEAARKIREQQKQAPKRKVWDNDNLPTAGSVSVVGQASEQGNANASAAQAAPEAVAPAAEGAENSGRDATKLNSELADAQKELNSLKTDLDLAQREYKLDSDQHFSMPNYSADQQGQAKLDAEKKQIDAKQQEVAAAQKKVDELQKQVDALTAKAKAANPQSN